MNNSTDTSMDSKEESKLNTADLDLYITTLENIFSSMVKKYNKLQLSEHNNQTITDANNLMKKGGKILNSMKLHVRSLETLMSDCDDFITEVTDDISILPKKEDFVYHSAGGMLSYPGRELIKQEYAKHLMPHPIVQPITLHVATPHGTPTAQPTIEKNIISEIGYHIKLPVVNNIKNIPVAMHYYKGDDKHPAGVYMNLPNNNIVRMPFPEIIDSKREYDRTHSIRCKYNLKEECNAQRAKMSKLYNSQVRVCNFAHAGDKIIKIGYPSRCPNVPDFGNPSTMANDVKKVNINDIHNMLLYGLNDVICSVVYLDYNNITDKIMATLEKA